MSCWPWPLQDLQDNKKEIEPVLARMCMQIGTNIGVVSSLPKSMNALREQQTQFLDLTHVFDLITFLIRQMFVLI